MVWQSYKQAQKWSGNEMVRECSDAQRQLVMCEASLRGSLFDHFPMAPPIVHPVKVSITAGYLLGPATLEKGGYDLGFRV